MGNSDTTCELYSAFHDNGPRWGLTGENDREITNHIMCCLKADHFQLPQWSNTIGEHDESIGNSDSIHRPPTLEEDEQYNKGQNHDSSEKQSTVQSSSSHNNIINNEASQQYPNKKDPLLHQISQADLQELLIFYEPLWFSRAYGWSGTDLPTARDFCQTKAGKRDICPYVAYCPRGMGGDTSQDKIEGYTPQRMVEWAPMKEMRESHWVGVGKLNACQIVRDVGEFDLGVGERVEDVTGNIMCCKDQPELDGDR